MSSYTTNRPPPSLYDNDGLDSDEEEEERLLSEQHGEAADDAGPKRKRGSKQADTKLTEEDAAAAKEFEDKIRRKKPRPALQPVDLKSAKGLVFVRRSFPTQVKKYRHVPVAKKVRGTGVRSNALAHKLNTASQINAAASFSRSLMGAYRDFATELFPSLAVEDVFLKVEDLGSKKDVKDYLEIMRSEMRREYMEGNMGVGKAGRILNELEHGLSSGVHPMDNVDGGYTGGHTGQLGDGADVAPRMGHAVTNEEEDGAETPPASPPVVVANPYASKKADVISAPEEDGVQENDDSNDNAQPMTVDKSLEAGDEEDEEEAEATFSVNGDSDNNADDAPTSETNEESAALAHEKSVELPADIEKQDDADNASTSEMNEGGAALAHEQSAELPADIEEQDDAEEAEKTTEEMDTEQPEKETAEETPSTEKLAEGSEELNTIAKESQTENNANLETPTQVNNDANSKTQETLTLVESQFDNAEMGYTQDERFSQISANEKPTNTQDETFSQTQDEHFSQAIIKEGGTQEEENTERFSQFTQPTGPVFEEDGDNGAEKEESNDIVNSDQLGQTMEMSMEY